VPGRVGLLPHARSGSPVDRVFPRFAKGARDAAFRVSFYGGMFAECGPLPAVGNHRPLENDDLRHGIWAVDGRGGCVVCRKKLRARAFRRSPKTMTRATALREPSGCTCTAICRIMVVVMAEETQQTTARLEARLPNDVHALLKRAAEIEGRTLTDFVVSAAREAACRTIEATEIIRLSVEDQRQIAEALLNPPEPTPALKKAFQRRRELLGGE
jgi:uncharacterized protein (DUF1778 family)